jgi:hypothetical protein
MEKGGEMQAYKKRQNNQRKRQLAFRKSEETWEDSGASYIQLQKYTQRRTMVGVKELP